jgi:hypothetical protein
MKYGLFVLALSIAAPALAQTHPCDQAAVASFTVNAGTNNLDVCWNDKDADGVAAVAKEWAVYIDGARVVVSLAKVSAPASATGFFVYRGIVAVAKGVHVADVEVSVDDGIGGLRATRLTGPFDLKARGAAPAPPVKPRVY